MAIAAAIDGTLMPSTRHDFPLVAVPSVIVGDFLILPILNGVVFPVLVRDASALMKRRTLLFSGASIAILVVSGLVNAATHRAWIQDQYTGFMDSQLGQLSVAGWWHLAFSVVQMALLLLVAVVWVSEGRLNASHHDEYLTGWTLLVVFTSLGIVGALVTRFAILPDSALDPGRVLVSLTPFVGAVVFLIAAMEDRRRSPFDQSVREGSTDSES